MAAAAQLPARVAHARLQLGRVGEGSCRSLAWLLRAQPRRPEGGEGLTCQDPFSSPCLTSRANVGIKILSLLCNVVFGRKRVPSSFWGVCTRNTFGKKKVLHTYTPAHPPVHLAGCSSVTCLSSPLIYHISNSILMSIFQGLFKHQWPYPMNEGREKKKKANILAAVNKAKIC